MCELLSEAANGGALLTLGYEMLQPQSPQHPSLLGAMEGGEEGEREREEGEKRGGPVIHRVNIQCTAVDAIGTV